MLKAYKYQLLPTENQAIHINQIVGNCRFVYNLALESKIMAYQSGKSLTCFDLSKQLTDLKKDEKTVWLKETPSQSLQQVLSNLDNAYTNFFKGRADFPTFKRRRGKESFRIPVAVEVDFENWVVKLPKLGQVEFCRDRKFEGTVKQATVSKMPSGKYFVSILVDTGVLAPKKQPIVKETAVGIDVGVKTFAVLSDNTKIENPKYLKRCLDRLKTEQNRMKRRYKKGKKWDEQSRSYRKQKLVVAKLHEKVRNQRNDFLHKCTTAIVKRYDTICVETLNIKGMSATCKPKQDENGKYLPNGQSAKSGLNKAILDCGWGEFFRQLEYKSEWYGKNLLKIGRFEASSKICSCCGAINKTLTLKDREWVCASCGKLHDRDENAAENIKNFAVTDITVRRKRSELSQALPKEPHSLQG